MGSGGILLASKLQPKAEVYLRKLVSSGHLDPHSPSIYSADHFHHEQHSWVILRGIKCYRDLFFKLLFSRN